jgi:hypothetical protein
LSEEKKKAEEKEDALEYLVAVSYILVNNAPQKISAMADIERMISQLLFATENVSPTSGTLVILMIWRPEGKRLLNN